MHVSQLSRGRQACKSTYSLLSLNNCWLQILGACWQNLKPDLGQPWLLER
eukprot:UN03696